MNMANQTKKKRPRYVLIIEDNVHHAELITEILDRHFEPVVIHTVDTFRDGTEFVRQSDYDLIITGGFINNEPVLGIITLLRKIAGNTPILVISGRGDERVAAETIKRGAAEYLAKTRETLDALPDILEKILSKKSTTKKYKSRHKAMPEEAPSASAIIHEVDRLTQEAMAFSGPRRKRRGLPQDVEQLDRLFKQIQRLRALTSKLSKK